jgi:hypothetical protein
LPLCAQKTYTLVCSRENATYIQLDSATQIQVVDSMADVAGASKEQRGAFVRDERVLVAWTDELDQIVPLCKEFEHKVVQLVWHTRPASRAMFGAASMSPSMISSHGFMNDKIAEVDEDDEGKDIALQELAKGSPQTQPPPKRSFFGFGGKSKKSATTTTSDPEKMNGVEQRPMRLIAPIYNGLAAAFSLCKSLCVLLYLPDTEPVPVSQTTAERA